MQQLVPGPYRITAALSGFKTFVARRHHAAHRGNRHRQRAAVDRRRRRDRHRQRRDEQDRVEREHDLADDREQAHLGAAAQRPPGLHADAAHARHALHADDVRRDRLLGHARVGRQRIARRSTAAGPATTSSSWKARRAPAPAAAPATGTTRRRWTRSKSSRSATSSVDASFGRTSGGVVNMTLRSGTNQLRGSGIVLHRGTWLDANQIQNIRNNISNKEHKYFNGEGDGQRADPPQQDVLHGRLPGLLREHPVPGDAHGADRGAAARRLLADDDRQRHADPHLRSGDDDVHGELQLVHAAAVPRQRHPGESLDPIAQGAAAAHPEGRTRRRATSSGVEQLHQLAEHRALSLQLVSHAHRPRLQQQPSPVVQQQRATGASSIRNENALPEPAIRSDNYPTHRNHYLATVDDNRTIGVDDAVEHARLVGPVRRAARQGVRRRRSAAAVHRALPADRPAVPADQLRRLRRHVPARRSASRRTTPTRSTATLSKTHGPALRSSSAASSAPTSSTARTRSNSNGVFELQQRLHAPRSADQHRRGVGQRLRDVPARAADRAAAYDRHAAHGAVPLLRDLSCRTTGRSARARRSTSDCGGTTSRR